MEQSKAVRVKRPEVVKAIRETEDATSKPITLSRKDIIEHFEQFDGPIYGHLDSAVREWVRYFADKFVQGKGTERTIMAKWDRMVKKADKGTKQPEPKAEEKAVPATAKKD